MSTYNIPKNSSITINDPGKSVTSIAFSGLIRDFSAPDSPLTPESVDGIVSEAGTVSGKTITLNESVVESLNKSTIDIEIITLYYLIVKIYEQEKEMEKDNNKNPIDNTVNNSE